jgi:hypothetical protein
MPPELARWPWQKKAALTLQLRQLKELICHSESFGIFKAKALKQTTKKHFSLCHSSGMKGVTHLITILIGYKQGDLLADSQLSYTNAMIDCQLRPKISQTLLFLLYHTNPCI